MFDDAKEPADIFADVDKPGPARSALQRPAAPVAAPAAYAAAGGGMSKLLIGIIAVVVLLGAGGGGYYFFVLRGQKGPAQEPAVNGSVTDGTGNDQAAGPADTEPGEIPPVNEAPEPATPEDEPAVTPPTPEPETPVAPPEPAVAPPDADNDGLSDDEEAQLGTNPQAVDTDNDELTDREEVKIYKTDPNKPDTDGDGYIDGQEVKGGYNPNGPGKLLQLPPQK